jgi:cell division protein FtsN
METVPRLRLRKADPIAAASGRHHLEQFMASKDTEITLGTGKMLAIFFTLVAICAVFFGLGFTLGKNSARPSLSADTALTASQPGIRPAASRSGVTPAAQSQEGMTFYKAVGQKEPDSQFAKASPNPVPTTQPAVAPEKTPEPASDPTAAPAGTGYFVQVAAVSKQDDALALVDALKKKQYTAFAANPPGDKLFHVQVGPFSDIKDAEITRGRLISDGYNPILKK